MGVLEGAPAVGSTGLVEDVLASVDRRTLDILEHRSRSSLPHGRNWLVRRALVAADVLGLVIAVVAASYAAEGGGLAEVGLFLFTLPAWVVLAKLGSLYERDEQLVDHSTVEDAVGVFHVITVGAWLYLLAFWAADLPRLDLDGLVMFWALALVLVTALRAVARAWCRTTVAYVQNTIVVGAGDLGQVIGRKLMLHPEYGINLVGFVDDAPDDIELRGELQHLAVLGTPDRLAEMVELLDVERVIIAGPGEASDDPTEIIRRLRDLDVQIDIVPQLFELVGPRACVHAVEGLPLVGLPPARLPWSSLLIKRTIDVVGAVIGLVLTAPLFAFIAWKIKRDSPGPVFFRQRRLAMNQREFTALKFRTMKVDTDNAAHREYIKSTMSAGAELGSNGMYKLERTDAVTPVGRWLRKTSLDELPQLINVLRGEMSLVGPRPCIAYETEFFAPHHFERFLVPAGLTGLWQVTARASSTFGEALDMDVLYARGWSLGLDLKLLFRTPFQLLRQKRATA